MPRVVLLTRLLLRSRLAAPAARLHRATRARRRPAYVALLGDPHSSGMGCLDLSDGTPLRSVEDAYPSLVAGCARLRATASLFGRDGQFLTVTSTQPSALFYVDPLRDDLFVGGNDAAFAMLTECALPAWPA